MMQTDFGGISSPELESLKNAFAVLQVALWG